MSNFEIAGKLVDIISQKIYPARVTVKNGLIHAVTLSEPDAHEELPYILPGFIDAHVHIESSMLVPSQFARLAVVHGTVATVSDPHEIANVCGVPGIDYMIEDAKRVPFYFYFGAPSCVPATVFETAGATVSVEDLDILLQRDEIKYLSEMMNFPGVLNQTPEVMAKIAIAQKYRKPVDGHAPGLRGSNAAAYTAAGISTDHECFTKEEAEDKLKLGMHILIREGSAAKNFEALIDLLHDYPEQMMFCSDDKHPDSLVKGHINELCARAVAKGIDIYKVLRAACINPVLHYKLDTGLLQPGDSADFILVDNLETFNVKATYIRGELVAQNGQTLIPGLPPDTAPVNNFNCLPKHPEDFTLPRAIGAKGFPVIEALDGQLITAKLVPESWNGDIDPAADILKIVVVNRYEDAPVATAFIKNFGLQSGAIASSVAHDSHNIVAVGADDESICRAVNSIIQNKGGVSLYSTGRQMIVPLPVGGIMSDKEGYEIADAYAVIDKVAKELGSTLSSPFMTLSFMALLVIPHVKLSDKGLFDGDGFCFYTTI
ncbi:MAG: adenine deaminase [Chitinophagaceae bacterium]|nr:adenine deaminase [Chitinophagaceae bacterium]MCW5927609.1 adenine deaminase [Chitinophagaceae bacterium]